MEWFSNPSRFHKIVRGEASDVSAWCWRRIFWWLRLAYGLGVALRNWAYDTGVKKTIRVPAVVISVGNLTLGGTGKTPCVEYLAKLIRELGYAVAIVSRGYGSVDDGANDEALMLEEQLPDVPHLQNRDRVAAALTACTELEAEVILLDDGFQHRRLFRHFNIVLIDSRRSIFDDWLFPRGTLREPISSLTRADAIILTKCDPNFLPTLDMTRLKQRFPDKILALARHKATCLVTCTEEEQALERLHGQYVGLICGIAEPTAFQLTVEELTARPTPAEHCRFFPDHHNYSRADVQALQDWASQLPTDVILLTTQKDLVKLQLHELAGRPLFAVRIEFTMIDGEAALKDRLQASLSQTEAV